MSTISGYEYDYQGVARTDTFLTKPVSAVNSIRLAFTFRKNGQPSAQGYLELSLVARLAVNFGSMIDQPGCVVWVMGQYAVRQATASLRVWDVTNPLVPGTQAYVLSATQEAGWTSSNVVIIFCLPTPNF